VYADVPENFLTRRTTFVSELVLGDCETLVYREFVKNGVRTVETKLGKLISLGGIEPD
jgi:hypothetical protein